MVNIQIIGVPMDLGADRRGVDMGPSAIRYAGLSERLRAIGHKVEDMGNIEAPIVEASKIEYANAKYLSEVRNICLKLSRVVHSGLSARKTPIVLGGDHSIAIGSFAGIYAASKKTTGVVWLDAHADFNTPDITPSGNIHGMGLALSCGQGGKWFPSPPWPKQTVDPKRVVIVGARQIDPEEQLNLKKAGIRVFTMSDIDRKGLKLVMNQAIKIASGSKHEQIHVSFDLDVVDPSDAPGVGTPVRGGITYREAHLAMEMISEAGVMRSLEMVEVNPILDEQNRTAELAVELILSAMGKKII
ncbi:MAG: arginase [Nitrososphaerota archaeon]|nr:arginase [Nitrososphaerota archaeon]